METEKQKTITQSIREVPNHIKIMIKSIVALVSFILGFNFAGTNFFKEYPLFNVPFLAEFLISSLAAMIGYFIIPKFFMLITTWIEQTIYAVVGEIVSNFWDQQSKRMQTAKRDRQKKRAAEIQEKIQREFSYGILLDTSVLIDGRILDIVKTNFLENIFVVPRFVIDELHTLSDSKDEMKRQKGRRGLDMLKKLRKQAKLFTPESGNIKGKVDKRLVRFAKQNKLRLMTMDFNLNKVASVEEIKVLNINDLANAVKIVFIPGEIVEVRIVHPGKEREQGVGYLEDGTMIVVEDTKDRVDQEVKAKVSKVIQSSAGKIIFCDLVK